MGDVREMLARGLIDAEDLLARLGEIEPHLYRYPAIDPPSFRRAVERTAATAPPLRGDAGAPHQPEQRKPGEPT